MIIEKNMILIHRIIEISFYFCYIYTMQINVRDQFIEKSSVTLRLLVDADDKSWVVRLTRFVNAETLHWSIEVNIDPSFLEKLSENEVEEIKNYVYENSALIFAWATDKLNRQMEEAGLDTEKTEQ